MSEALRGGAAFPVPHCRVPTIVLECASRRRRRCCGVCVWCLCLVSRVGIAEEKEEGEEFHGFVLMSFQGVPVVSSGQLHACMDACLLAWLLAWTRKRTTFSCGRFEPWPRRIRQVGRIQHGDNQWCPPAHSSRAWYHHSNTLRQPRHSHPRIAVFGQRAYAGAVRKSNLVCELIISTLSSLIHDLSLSLSRFPSNSQNGLYYRCCCCWMRT
jgi:hypothetical protein